MVIQNLDSFQQLFQEYTELRAQENRHVRIAMINGDIAHNQKTAVAGVAARVYKHGVWGFASHPEVNDATIAEVVRSATDNAVFLDTREQRGAGPLPAVSAEDEHDFSLTDEPRVSQKELIEFLNILDSYLLRYYTKLHSRTLVLDLLEMEKTLLTSDASAAHSMIPRAILYVVLSVEKDGEPIELYNVYGGFGHFENNFAAPDHLFERIDQQYEHLLRKADGVYPQAGLAECVLDADLAGILAHEAAGHTTEADFVMGGSVAGDYLNQQVASPLISMVDFAHTAHDTLCPVPVFVDDEGTPATDATLIKDGVLKGYMHNKESANHFQMPPTGNARAFQFSDEPLIRMRNTAILPGQQTITDMIASIEHGYYLMKASNGQADSTGEFMFGIVQGYEIKHGRLDRALKDTTISGVAFDMLKSVTMVSDEMVWKCGGMCGKKQPIPVGMGGPAIKCQVNIGGK
jgi:TldD protein